MIAIRRVRLATVSATARADRRTGTRVVPISASLPTLEALHAQDVLAADREGRRRASTLAERQGRAAEAFEGL